MGHFWIRESHFAPEKASWCQNDVRPNYVTELFVGDKFPTQQRIAC